jgi:hypothetical protein
MCDHPISRSIVQAHQGPVIRISGEAFACEAYADHATELHHMVLRIVPCADCADLLVAHSFLTRPAVHGVQPTLAQLTRTALVFACGALGGKARMQLQARIRAWYMDPGAQLPSPAPAGALG